MDDTTEFYRLHKLVEGCKKVLETGYAGTFNKKKSRELLPELRLALAAEVERLGYDPIEKAREDLLKRIT